MRELFYGKKAKFISYSFQSLLIIYLCLLLVEQIWKKSISSYINLNYFLIPILILGILDVFSEKPLTFGFKRRSKKSDYFLITVLGILALIIIKYKTASLGWLSWAISLIAGVLIVLLSVLILEEE